MEITKQQERLPRGLAIGLLRNARKTILSKKQIDILEARVRILQARIDRIESDLKSTISLEEAKVAYLKAKTARLKSIEKMIKVDSSELHPHIEKIMWDLFQAIQKKSDEDN
ncbi:uncharacterized protein Dvar_36140 [Desulfosarcina variabilis str. Montpellier]|uniref:hypothetical protein n=1 Tax=Desulfosarcina variabilis TaxID=2300 RepID=UPI003AFA8BBF